MKLEAVELRRVGLPLVAPFRTSFGTETHKDALLVRAIGSDTEGWSECVAMIDPLYSSEYVDAAEHVLRHHLLPRLFVLGDVAADAVGDVLAPVKGHRMAKAAIETVILDAVSVGIMDSIPKLLDTVDGYLAQGYRRIKLKIEPGWDIDPVRPVRERFGYRSRRERRTCAAARIHAARRHIGQRPLLLARPHRAIRVG